MNRMEKQLTLLPWPNPNWKENPYQRLLCQGLQQNGIRLIKTPLSFSILPYLPKFDWLYLYWSEQLYAAKEPHKRAEQFERFIKILLKLKKRGIRILWTMNNEFPHEADDVEFHKQAYAKIIELSDLIHVHFAAAVEHLKQTYQVDARKIVVVPHGHYSNYYGTPIPKAEARQIFGIPPEAIVMLNFGYLRKYKGIEEAIASFHETQNPRLYFLIAGEPADENIVEYFENERRRNPRLIMQLSKIKEKDFVPLLSAADSFMFPSRTFFTSGSIMLALTYNLPFIAIPKNHTLYFLGKSFFKPWQPADKKRLTEIMDGLGDWLASVNYEELAKMKNALDTNKLTVEFSRRLKGI